ncbi:MAG: hypothetical protein NTZ83_04015 [Candidatus Pacearchaeota archaeon]|nr:hypothetical protein [Candidatus Pacearchaeota archaeon]
MRKRGRKGQLDISFGMIFSIILIIIFIAAGFYAITKVIEFQKSVQIQNFMRDFQDDVTKMWGSNQGSQDLVYSLPTNINAVCFRNNEFQNLEFSSKGIVAGKLIEHIDIAKTTKDESPLCIQNVKGKVSFTIAKDYGEALVTAER